MAGRESKGRVPHLTVSATESLQLFSLISEDLRWYEVFWGELQIRNPWFKEMQLNV